MHTFRVVKRVLYHYQLFISITLRSKCLFMVFLHDYTHFLRIVLHGYFNIKYFILTYSIII